MWNYQDEIGGCNPRILEISIRLPSRVFRCYAFMLSPQAGDITKSCTKCVDSIYFDQVLPLKQSCALGNDDRS